MPWDAEENTSFGSLRTVRLLPVFLHFHVLRHNELKNQIRRQRKGLLLVATLILSVGFERDCLCRRGDVEQLGMMLEDHRKHLTG